MDSPVLAPTKEERHWAMLAHLSAFLLYVSGILHIVAPLVIWLWKKDESAFVGEQAREALNFQISISIYGAAAILLCFTIIGLIVGVPVLLGLGLFQMIMMVVAALKANDGVAYRYPLTLRIV